MKKFLTHAGVGTVTGVAGLLFGIRVGLALAQMQAQEVYDDIQQDLVEPPFTEGRIVLDTTQE